ncbi:DJ-1/PfpI family protein [Candidatus Peregrinibacteria bacterium]|nr:DJ-1/PfpI family protein [Candidatus Peregrinibacteria bacterium]
MRKPALVIIAQTGYQDIELEGTRKGLFGAGFDVVLASKAIGPCRGKLGGTEQASIAMKDVNVSDYDRIAFIGGPGAGALKDDSNALRIARETVAAKIPLGAICIAPTILAAAGVLKGKKATVWDSGPAHRSVSARPSRDGSLGEGGGEQIEFLKQKGADYSGEAVTRDGLIVTGNGPKAAEEFGRTFAAIAAE